MMMSDQEDRDGPRDVLSCLGQPQGDIPCQVKYILEGTGYGGMYRLEQARFSCG